MSIRIPRKKKPSQLTPEEKQQLREWWMKTRSHRSIAQDLRKKARIPRTVGAWMSRPNKYDIPGIDEPESIIEEERGKPKKKKKKKTEKHPEEPREQEAITMLYNKLKEKYEKIEAALKDYPELLKNWKPDLDPEKLLSFKDPEHARKYYESLNKLYNFILLNIEPIRELANIIMKAKQLFPNDIYVTRMYTKIMSRPISSREELQDLFVDLRVEGIIDAVKSVDLYDIARKVGLIKDLGELEDKLKKIVNKMEEKPSLREAIMNALFYHYDLYDFNDVRQLISPDKLRNYITRYPTLIVEIPLLAEILEKQGTINERKLRQLIYNTLKNMKEKGYIDEFEYEMKRKELQQKLRKEPLDIVLDYALSYLGKEKILDYIGPKLVELKQEIIRNGISEKTAKTIIDNFVLGVLENQYTFNNINELLKKIEEKKTIISEAEDFKKGNIAEIFKKHYIPFGKLKILSKDHVVDEIGGLKIHFKHDKTHVYPRIIVTSEVDGIKMGEYNVDLLSLILGKSINEKLRESAKFSFGKYMVGNERKILLTGGDGRAVFVGIFTSDGIHVLYPEQKFYRYGDVEFLKKYLGIHPYINEVIYYFKHQSNMPVDVDEAYEYVKKFSDGTYIAKGIDGYYYLVYRDKEKGTIHKEKWKTLEEVNERLAELVKEGKIVNKEIINYVAENVKKPIVEEIKKAASLEEEARKIMRELFDEEGTIRRKEKDKIVLLTKDHVSAIIIPPKIEVVKQELPVLHNAKKVTTSEILVEAPEKLIQDFKYVEEEPDLFTEKDRKRIMKLKKLFEDKIEKIGDNYFIKLTDIPVQRLKYFAHHEYSFYGKGKDKIIFRIGNTYYELPYNVFKKILREHKYPESIYYTEKGPVAFIFKEFALATVPKVEEF